MIEIKNGVYETPGFKLLLNFHVAANNFVAVLGGSGAGKSTLLTLLAGFDDLKTGDIVLDGRSMAGVAPNARPLSLVFQDHNVFAHLSVWNNVALGLAANLKLNETQRAQVDDALQRVGLKNLAQRKPGDISGGERQRVALARTLVRKRKIILLDEPFAALDPGLRQDMLALVQELRREHQLTVLMVTHQPEEARAAADHVLFIAGGVARAPVPTGAFFNVQGDVEIETYLGTNS